MESWSRLTCLSAVTDGVLRGTDKAMAPVPSNCRRKANLLLSCFDKTLVMDFFFCLYFWSVKSKICHLELV